MSLKYELYMVRGPERVGTVSVVEYAASAFFFFFFFITLKPRVE